MDIKEIEQLVRVFDASTLGRLEIQEPERTLILERGGSAAPAMPVAPASAPPSTTQATAEEETGGKPLCAPMVGTFHFAKGCELTVGQTFKKGEVLCVIEAMKLMNDLLAEEDGRLMWLAVQDGDFVEYGQVLLQYEPLS